MDYQIEIVARAFYDAENGGRSWDSEPETIRHEFRTYARNVIALMGDEIGVLLLELQSSGLPKAA